MTFSLSASSQVWSGKSGIRIFHFAYDASIIHGVRSKHVLRTLTLATSSSMSQRKRATTILAIGPPEAETFWLTAEHGYKSRLRLQQIKLIAYFPSVVGWQLSILTKNMKLKMNSIYFTNFIPPCTILIGVSPAQSISNVCQTESHSPSFTALCVPTGLIGWYFAARCGVSLLFKK